ncbi:hypothetical protein VTJ49DRAFT_3101 [Mycothermus thermophilus]|uniref:Voltage-dependent anion channel n=1 Tax=Humicola insolens TaxID=85995 RepID=A0ABR3VAA5_HUMIN
MGSTEADNPTPPSFQPHPPPPPPPPPPPLSLASTTRSTGTTSATEPHRAMSASSPGAGELGAGPRPRRERTRRRHRKSDAESTLQLDDDPAALAAPSPPTPPTPPDGDGHGDGHGGGDGDGHGACGSTGSMGVLERVPTLVQPSLPWRNRLMHFTFAWYTVTMSTAGVALTLALIPYRFPGLSYIGLALFLLDVAFFVLISAAILARFLLYHPTLRRAFTRPSEALFVSTLFLSVAAMLSNTAVYARIFLSEAKVQRLARGFLRPAFWVYLGLAFACSVLQYHLLFTVKKPARRLRVDAMTPAWILPVFPVMLAGTLAGTCATELPDPRQAVAIMAAGLAAQGTGWAVSCFMYATYLSRLMVFGLPVQRPGMFIAVGPPSFTSLALVTMAGEVPRVLEGLAGQAATERVNGRGGSSLSVWAVAAGLGEGETRALAASVQIGRGNAGPGFSFELVEFCVP